MLFYLYIILACGFILYTIHDAIKNNTINTVYLCIIIILALGTKSVAVQQKIVRDNEVNNYVTYQQAIYNNDIEMLLSDSVYPLLVVRTGMFESKKDMPTLTAKYRSQATPVEVTKEYKEIIDAVRECLKTNRCINSTELVDKLAEREKHASEIDTKLFFFKAKMVLKNAKLYSDILNKANPQLEKMGLEQKITKVRTEMADRDSNTDYYSMSLDDLVRSYANEAKISVQTK